MRVRLLFPAHGCPSARALPCNWCTRLQLGPGHGAEKGRGLQSDHHDPALDAGGPPTGSNQREMLDGCVHRAFERSWCPMTAPAISSTSPSAQRRRETGCALHCRVSSARARQDPSPDVKKMHAIKCKGKNLDHVFIFPPCMLASLIRAVRFRMGKL
eukprot:scaffold3808_cov112-Isochrysis_galbana.AAC.6